MVVGSRGNWWKNNEAKYQFYTTDGEAFELNENIAVTDLQNAAHQAVAQWKAENP